MDDNIRNEIYNQKTRALRARATLIFMIILSAINVFITFASSGNSDLIMPFSCAISTYAAAFGSVLYETNGNIVFYIVGIIIAVLIIAFLIVCYFKSKNKVVYLVSALAAIIVDTIALIALSFSGNAIADIIDISNVFTNIIIHFLIIWYLVVGIKAYRMLGDLNNISDELVYEKCNPYEESEDVEIEKVDILTENNEDDQLNELEPLLTGTKDNHNIIVAVHGDNVELIVDDEVYDSVNFAYNPEFKLSCAVDEIDISFQYNRSYASETAYLYAGNELLDSYFKDNF